jgi:hypothetical protein
MDGRTMLKILAAFVGVSICVSAALAADPLSRAVTGKSAVTVFRYSTGACASEDVPDAPARAVRDAAGNVHMFASHYVNRQMIGRSLTRLTHKCDVVCKMADEPTPENFNNRGWLASFYTGDGRTVMALVH